MSGMVTEDSAILVERIIFLKPSGTVWNIFLVSSNGIRECRGKKISFSLLSGSWALKDLIMVAISNSPGRKIKTAPFSFSLKKISYSSNNLTRFKDTCSYFLSNRLIPLKTIWKKNPFPIYKLRHYNIKDIVLTFLHSLTQSGYKAGLSSGALKSWPRRPSRISSR